MKYKIKTKREVVNVEVRDVEGKEEQLLEAFQECQEGRCSCPTREYTKLESLEIKEGAGTIDLRLRAKKGEKIDQREIERCLQHTEGCIKPQGE